MHHPRQARDIMITRLVTLTPQTDVLDGIGILLRNNVSGAPVLGADRDYLGVFSEKSSLQVYLELTSKALERSTTERLPHVSDFMARRLVTLTPDMDALKAVGLLLRNHISGAPVKDATGRYVGVFSEKTSMKAILDGAYDRVPACSVDAYTDRDPARLISPQATLLDVIRLFMKTHFRRLPVVSEGYILGQVSRRDVLRAADRYVAEAFADQIPAVQGIGLLQSERVEGPSPSALTGERFMDRSAQTTAPDTDLLAIAMIFAHSPFRRLPVIDGEGRLMGQVSRRDLLQAIHEMVRKTEGPHQVLLYLSSVHDPAKEGNLPIEA